MRKARFIILTQRSVIVFPDGRMDARTHAHARVKIDISRVRSTLELRYAKRRKARGEAVACQNCARARAPENGTSEIPSLSSPTSRLHHHDNFT